MTKDDLRRAYDACVGRCGRTAAVEAVQQVTGQIYLDAIADDKIAAVIDALKAATATKKPLTVARGPRHLSVVDSLRAIAERVYGRR